MNGIRLRRAGVASATALSLALLAACSEADGAGPAPTSPPASTTAAPAPTPAPATSPPAPSPVGSTPPSGPVTLAFGGDVHFTTHLADLLRRPRTSLASLRPVLGAADVAMVNLETAITERGRPAPKTFHFRAGPQAVTALDAAGVDVASLANNHSVDYGEAGLRDTLAARGRSPIPLLGLGRDEQDAYAPAYLNVRGTRIALLAATQVGDWTLATWPARPGRPGVASAAPGAGLDRLGRAVRAASRRADVVVVYLHWGTEYTSCPSSRQRDTARALSRAGADVVLGSHAHRLQGAGWMGRTYVDYGLGNFVWWRRSSPGDVRTGVLTLTVDPARAGEGSAVTGARWTPMVVGASGVPAVRTGAQGRRLLADWRELRECAGLAARPPG